MAIWNKDFQTYKKDKDEVKVAIEDEDHPGIIIMFFLTNTSGSFNHIPYMHPQQKIILFFFA